MRGEKRLFLFEELLINELLPRNSLQAFTPGKPVIDLLQARLAIISSISSIPALFMVISSRL